MASGPSRVAVCAAEGDLETAQVAERFARAPRFVVFERGQCEASILANDARSQEQGAGAAAVALLVRNGIDTVVAKRLGPKAAEALRVAGLESHLTSLTSVRAVERWLEAEVWHE